MALQVKPGMIGLWKDIAGKDTLVGVIASWNNGKASAGELDTPTHGLELIVVDKSLGGDTFEPGRDLHEIDARPLSGLNTLLRPGTSVHEAIEAIGARHFDSGSGPHWKAYRVDVVFDHVNRGGNPSLGMKTGLGTYDCVDTTNPGTVIGMLDVGEDGTAIPGLPIVGEVFEVTKPLGTATPHRMPFDWPTLEFHTTKSNLPKANDFKRSLMTVMAYDPKTTSKVWPKWTRVTPSKDEPKRWATATAAEGFDKFDDFDSYIRDAGNQLTATEKAITG